MKYLTFTFSIMALAAILGAIWRTDYAWPCGLSAIVFLIAASVTGAASTKAEEKIEADK